MEILRSEKNKPMGHCLDHFYWKESGRTNDRGIARTYWRCIFWEKGCNGEKSSKCPGRAVSFSDGIQITAEHNHSGDKARVELKRMQGGLQKQAMESREAPRAIIGKAIQKVEKWNPKELVVTDQPRTGNGMESFNGQMIRIIATSHPTIWKLIEGLRDEFGLSLQKVESRRAGERSPKRGIAYRQLDERLKNTVTRYNEISKVKFLQSIALNLDRIQVFVKPKELPKKNITEKVAVSTTITLEDSTFINPNQEEVFINGLLL